MNLSKLSLYHLSLALNFSFASAKQELNRREVLVLEVRDMEGNFGYGECVAFSTPFYTDETLLKSWAILTEDYLPLIFEQFKSGSDKLKHPFEIHKIFDNKYPMALACLENALVDLYYRANKKNTIQEIFDEELKPSTNIGIVLSDNLSDTEIYDKISFFSKQGCKRFKLKISPNSDFKSFREIISHYTNKNNLKFLVDANASFKLSEFKKLQELDDLKLLCIEEPFAYKNISDCENLAKKLKTPICFDESIQTLEQLEKATKLKAFGVLNVKIGKFGGLYHTKKIIEFCRKNNIAFWIGSMLETSISKMLHIQLSCLKDIYIEGDLSDNSRYFIDNFTYPEISFNHGAMLYPNGFGLGADVIKSSILKNCLKKWEIQ